MMTKLTASTAGWALCLFAFSTAPSFSETRVLWRVGVPDRNNAEFSHAPGDFAKASRNGLFIVGQSESTTDWPYVHPGPADSWAGRSSHTFTVLFGLSGAPSPAGCRLVLDVLDTHGSQPPKVRIQVNEQQFEKALPSGTGDATVYGEPGKGKPVQWSLEIPGTALKAGENEVSITTLSGSWFLYDALRFEAPADLKLAGIKPRTMLSEVQVPPYWLKRTNGATQPIRLALRHVGAGSKALISAGDYQQEVEIRRGSQTVIAEIPASNEKRRLDLQVRVGDTLLTTNLMLQPPGIREMWILPHSHVDIGYTHHQEEVVQAQIGHIRKALQLAEASANQPEELRFKWNPEAVWVVDHFLTRANPEEREKFLRAVRQGVIGVEGLYGNILTALCRPEELAQCLAFAARVSNLTGSPVKAATICDVPGYTWGIVPMMAQAGVRYFAIGPNFHDRIGTIHLWDDKPFYWQSQSRQEQVLCWVVDNYHHLGNLEENVVAQVERQSRAGFPYNLSFLLWVGRWPSGAVDNAPPDEDLVSKAAAWNEKYAAPRLRIGLTADFFEKFEREHGRALPRYSGDLTPYWEDGAGSTSRETAMNRASADRLSQASALFAMAKREQYPRGQFEAAWKNVLLYTEHTWGAWCSISKPDDKFTLDQWNTKRAFAVDADKMSHELLKQALPPASSSTGDSLEVFNTTQWKRSELAMIPPDLARGYYGVLDDHGRRLPAQRLSSGAMVFTASDIPPFGSRNFRMTTGVQEAQPGVRVTGTTLENAFLRIEMDANSGAIKSLRRKGVKADLVDRKAPVGLNDFRYVLGEDAQHAQTNGPVTIRISEQGPLLAALRIESTAPGCGSLVREIRLAAGMDHVELVNHVDRLSIREKDAVHFGFAFNVPDAELRMETPWAVVRPNVDQLPGANRNWFTVQRWVDISAKSH